MAPYIEDPESITMANPIISPKLAAGIDDTHAPLKVSRLAVNGIANRRSTQGPMPKGIAAFGTSDMYKGDVSHLPKAISWDSILSTEAKSRKGAALKQNAIHLAKPGMISLGGGLPSSEYFPFETIQMQVNRPEHFALSPAQQANSLMPINIGKHDAANDISPFDIHIAFNYGQSCGAPQLLRWVTEHTELVHNPPYADWQCTLDPGSTLGLEMLYRILCEKGDCLLTEEYAFATAIETCKPLGVNPVGVKMDAEGLIPEVMDEILTTWDPEAHDGARKPHLLYTVPSGQNPTGATQSEQRRREIYKVCQKHNVFIIEDEPYYFLQMNEYVSPSDTTHVPPIGPQTSAELLAAMIPSLLSMDVDGRVVRLDSFSKVIAPGARLGWITAPPQLTAALIAATDVSTQSPCGFSQLMVYKLVDETWGHDGFFRWLIHLREEYTRRRDVLVSACETYLPREVVDWVPASAGMFQWLRVHPQSHPLAKTHSALDVEVAVFNAIVDAKCLVSRGSWFIPEGPASLMTVPVKEGQVVFYRASFAAAAEGDIVEAIRRLGGAIRKSFALE